MFHSIIPSADTIPVHWLWLQGLLLFTFFMHMILVNLLLGGSLLTAWDLLTGKLERRTSGSIHILVALTVNFGIPPLLFVQLLYGYLFYSSPHIPVVSWILVIPILILAYYGAYIFVKKTDKAPVLSTGALIFTSLSLLFIAFIFVNNNTLALQHGRWDIYFENPGDRNLNLADPTLWSRYLHFVLAALAIGALGRAMAYHFSKTPKKEKEIQIKRNLKIFAWITVLQFAVGSWFWLSMPETVWRTFLGASFFPTCMMVTGCLLAVLILHSSFAGKLKLAIVLGGLEVFNMVIIRDMVRGAYLKDIFKPSMLENMGEPSLLIVFLLIFAVSLLGICFMIRSAFKSKTSQS